MRSDATASFHFAVHQVGAGQQRRRTTTGLQGRIGNRLVRLIMRVRLRWQLARQIAAERRQLTRLAPTELQDIGISEAQQTAEARRAYWDIPSNRL